MKEHISPPGFKEVDHYMHVIYNNFLMWYTVAVSFKIIIAVHHAFNIILILNTVEAKIFIKDIISLFSLVVLITEIKSMMKLNPSIHR